MRQEYIDSSISLRLLGRLWDNSLTAALLRRTGAACRRVVAGSRALGILRVGDYLQSDREALLPLLTGSRAGQWIYRAGTFMLTPVIRAWARDRENFANSRASAFRRELAVSRGGRMSMAFLIVFLTVYLSLRAVLLVFIPQADRVTPLSAGIMIAVTGAVLLALTGAGGTGRGTIGRTLAAFRRVFGAACLLVRRGLMLLKKVFTGRKIPPVEGGPEF